jgi:hypothetical protein
MDKGTDAVDVSIISPLNTKIVVLMFGYFDVYILWNEIWE